jgi:short-subunit dehydrogenase
MTGPRIVITGASRGLGAAMARELAAPGVTLCLCARDPARLDSVAQDLRQRGAQVECAALDLGDATAVTAWLQDMWDRGPVDMAILNAGVFEGRGPDGTLEDPVLAAQIIRTNLTGAIAPALALAPRMIQRRTGRLVFISSLAAFSPQADAPSYSASKSGLTAFARALREDLADYGVAVSIAHPGHLRTDQTDRHIGPLPGLIEVEVAARIIVQALRRGQGEIAFPRSLRLGLALMSILPWRWQKWINRPLRFRVRRGP